MANVSGITNLPEPAINSGSISIDPAAGALPANTTIDSMADSIAKELGLTLPASGTNSSLTDAMKNKLVDMARNFASVFKEKFGTNLDIDSLLKKFGLKETSTDASSTATTASDSASTAAQRAAERAHDRRRHRLEVFMKQMRARLKEAQEG